MVHRNTRKFTLWSSNVLKGENFSLFCENYLDHINIINMERLFRGHRIEIEFLNDKSYLITCYRLSDNVKIFSYLDAEAKNPYESMNTAKIKIGKILTDKP